MKLGYFFGIPILVNPFFIVLLFSTALIGKLLETVILFIIVIWHESAHVMMARYYGLSVIEIELLPFGGVARIDELIQLEPGVERYIAIVGPLSNGVLLVMVWLLEPRLLLPTELLKFIIQANIGMMLFNVLPALPLDGGRFLRSLLTEKYGYRQATEKAASIGQIFGVLLLFIGMASFYYNYNGLIFLIIGFFLLISANKEKAAAVYVLMRYLTRKKQEVRLKRVMLAKELVATEETSLGEILRQLTPSYYHIVWVLDINGTLAGMITELEMIDAFLEKGIQTRLGELIKYHL